jgi:hypothetical protein
MEKDVRHHDARHIENPGLAVSTSGRDRGGEGRAIQGSTCAGKGKGDVLTSSQGQEGLINNETRGYSKEKVSKTKEAHTVPPPVVQTNHLPTIPLPTHSETHSNPPCGHQTAATSAQPRSFEGLCLQGLEELKLRQDDTVGDRRSKSNAETERKLADSSAEPQDRGRRPGSPSKVRKAPDKGGVQLKTHPTGATSYGRAKTNVGDKVEHNVPPNSPEAVYTQPRVPKRET